MLPTLVTRSLEIDQGPVGSFGCRDQDRLGGAQELFDGISDLNALHSGKHNDEVQLCAFDILALNGDDLRSLPLSMRKAHLERLLARRPDGSPRNYFSL